jgi:TetR/AcrR family transcriptional repressor of nem operon
VSDTRPADSAQKILDIAEQLAQTCGFNGFSYADIAERLGVTKAGLHYHFPSKAELGRALVERYHRGFARRLDDIARQVTTAPERLRRYVEIYGQVLRNDRMCLCGMFAAEYATLPAPMQGALRRFFDLSEAWLTSVLKEGLRSRTLKLREPPRERARLLLSALEGAMLVSRTYGDGGRFRTVATHGLADLGVGPAPRTRGRPGKLRAP